MKTLFSFLTLLFLVSCGSDSKVEPLSIPQYSAFKDVQNAPLAIQKVASAVVKIEIDQGQSGGTGSFVSSSRLLTNNHVVGVGNCSKLGCYASLFFSYEKGKEFQKKRVFLKPIFVSVPLDASLYDVYQEDQITPFHHSHTIEVSMETPKSLLRKKVFVVGHPSLSIKKWTEGEVISVDNQWIRSNNFSIGGNSGSPLINEQGQMVGLVHRSSNSHTQISETEVVHTSRSSSAKEIFSTKEKDANLAAFFDIGMLSFRVKMESYAPIHSILVNYPELSTKLLEPTTYESIVNSIGKQCDLTLRVASQTVTNDNGVIKQSLKECFFVYQWIQCLPDRKPHQYCPSSDVEKSNWLNRFEKVADTYHAWHSSTSEIVTAFARFAAALEDSSLKASDVYHQRLQKAIQRYDLGLDFELVFQKSKLRPKSSDLILNGIHMVEYLLNFESQPYYEHYSDDIVFALDNFYYGNMIETKTYREQLLKLFSSKKITIEAKLDAESNAYEAGLLE